MTQYQYFDFLKRARHVSPEHEVILYEGPGSIDKNQVAREFESLKNDITTPPEQSYCSVCYQIYKKIHKGRGRKFDRESFFLYWLANKMKFTKLEIIEKIVYKSDTCKGVTEYSIKPKQKIRNLEESISVFLNKELPNIGIDINPKRIKSKLWRFRKSGIMYKVKKAFIAERKKVLKSQPDYYQQSQKMKEEWKKLKFIYRVANFISQKPEGVSRREILRRFSNKRKDDIDEIMDVLRYDFGIEYREMNRGKDIFLWDGSGFGFVYFEAHKRDF